MILILTYTGMRINKLCSLKMRISIKGKNRLIPINYKILPLITKNMNLNSEYLFHTKTVDL